MPDDSQSRRNDLAVSQAALLILRAIVSDASNEVPYVLRLGSNDPIPVGPEAVSRLADASKPIECDASVVGSSVIADCRPLSRSNRGLWKAEQDLVRQARANNGIEALPVADATVLIVGQGASIELTPAQALQLETDYLFLGNYSVHETLADIPDAGPSVKRRTRVYEWANYVEISEPDP